MMQQPSAADYSYLREIVFAHSHNLLDPSRDYLFDVRLNKVLRNQSVSCIGELVSRLRTRKDPAVEHSIAEAMTVNETSFFRDTRPFEILRTELLPKLIDARHTTRTLRLWSAACSTGQEAYSLAMLLREHFSILAGWDIRIDGTDISAEVVERAKSGRYHRIEINRGLPARYIVRYFDHCGEDWTVKPEIKTLCNFRQANLCSHQPVFSRLGERFDLIFLRNVMLYFSHDTRRTLLASIGRLLAPDGILFLGSTEQPTDLAQWQAIVSGGTCYFKPRQSS